MEKSKVDNGKTKSGDGPTAPEPAAGFPLIDLGKLSRKKVRRLKQGCGRAIQDVAAHLAAYERESGQDLRGKNVCPVFVIVERKRKRRKRRRLFKLLPII